jgi:aminotransferase
MHLSKRGADVPHSGIREMFDKAAGFENVLNLGVGEPYFDTPENIINAAVEGLKSGHTKYTPNAGVLPLRKAIAEKLEKDNGIKSQVENIVVATGACEAITLCLFTLADPGDEILLPDPCWPNYYGQITVGGAIPVPVPTFKNEKFHITAKSIESAITPRTKGIILNSPSNPTGAVISKKELLEIASLIKEHSLFVIADEPYEKLVYDDVEFFSIGSLEGMEKHVLTVNSFSKSYAMTGWRVGYIHAPVLIAESIAKMQENFSSCVNSAAQFGAVEALLGPQDNVAVMRDSYRERRDIIVEGLNGIRGISCSVPEGAFYAFPDISELGMSSREFAFRLLEEKRVVTVPGEAFGACGEGHIRMSFAAKKETIKSAVKKIEEFVSSL